MTLFNRKPCASLCQQLIGIGIALACLPAFAGKGSVPSFLTDQVVQSVEDGRVEVVHIHAPKAKQCVPIESKVLRSIDHSMRVPVRFTGVTKAGDPCKGFAWVTVRYFRHVYVAADDIAARQPLSDALNRVEQEIKIPRDFLESVPSSSSARRMLRKGEVLMTGAIRANGLEPGSPINVTLLQGALRLSVTGTVIPCGGLRGCARLPSGKRVEGTMRGNTLIVEMP